jgi:hypothetical protein
MRSVLARLRDTRWDLMTADPSWRLASIQVLERLL